MSVHSKSLKGERDDNEDKHNVIINMNGNDPTKAPVNYYAVYDGHGGKFVSNFLSKNLPQCFIDKRVAFPLSSKFVKQIYNYWDKTLSTQYYKETEHTGSTCLVAIHYKKNNSHYLNVLNTGDSRCIICRNNIAIPITKDHKPFWPEEKARIEALGGKLKFDGHDWRIADLSVSRAFGDLDALPYITSTPDMFKYKLTSDDKFMVLACDGLWDVMESQDVVNFVLAKSFDTSSKSQNIANELGAYAINKKKSTDNVSIIIVFFK